MVRLRRHKLAMLVAWLQTRANEKSHIICLAQTVESPLKKAVDSAEIQNKIVIYVYC